MATFPVSVADREVTVEISESVYPVGAVHGASIIFIDKSYVRISRPANGRTKITLRAKAGSAPAEELQQLGGDFLNELLHQALRLEVGARTDKLRELVLGKGIMSAETVTDGGVAFSDDPLGIARPWEEKYLGEENGGRK